MLMLMVVMMKMFVDFNTCYFKGQVHKGMIYQHFSCSLSYLLIGPNNTVHYKLGVKKKVVCFH